MNQNFIIVMTDQSQINNISGMIQEILNRCHGDPIRTDIAITNFKALLDAMKIYEKAPKYFNALLEESETPIIMTNTTYPQLQYTEQQHETELYKYPIVGELEHIYGHKLKQIHLQKLGTALSNKIGLRLNRDTKRSKQLLLQWFSANWTTLHPKIYEFGFHKSDFFTK